MERRSEPLLFNGRMLKENKGGAGDEQTRLCEPQNKRKWEKS